jgi:hypothetical protein
VGGVAATAAFSGCAICGMAVGAGFGASARAGAEGVEADADGAVAIGAPPGLIFCEGAETGAEFTGGEVSAGWVDSKPEDARFRVANSPFHPGKTKLLLVAAGLASGRVSKTPAGKGAVCWLSSPSERESVAALSACSFCAPTGPCVVSMESSCVGRVGALLIKAKLAHAAATAASATPPATAIQSRERGLGGV